jgi:hypothetical protein
MTAPSAGCRRCGASLAGKRSDALQNFVDGLVDSGLTGDADFGAAVSQAASFFEGAGTKLRKVFVLSNDYCVDGSPEVAKNTLDAIDDVAVHCFLWGRFSLSSPNMNVFDNTPEDQQLGDPHGDCPVFFANSHALDNALTLCPIKNMDMNPAHIIRECLTDPN